MKTRPSAVIVATLFIADLHLCTEEPAITAGFLPILTSDARKADALYILGDLFEAGLATTTNPLHRGNGRSDKITVTDSGVPCFYSRQPCFLLSKRFARAQRDLASRRKKVLEPVWPQGADHASRHLMHRRRRLSGVSPRDASTRLQKLFLALPCLFASALPAKMRANIKAANSTKSLEIMDVNPQAVINEMEKHQVQWLIHGHTRPAVHELTAMGKPLSRVVIKAHGIPKVQWSKSPATLS